MPRHLTEKQRNAALEISKGGNPIKAILRIYNCGGKKPLVSASVILNKLNKNEMFKEELMRQQNLVKEVIATESQKLIDILTEIFPKIERARILVEIARTGDVRTKLAALQEINKIGGEYPIEEKAKTEIGELKITMIQKPPERVRVSELPKLGLGEKNENK